MKDIEQYELSDKQISACKAIDRAFKKAKKEGLSFLAKSENINAYKTSALREAVPQHVSGNRGDAIPYYSLRNNIDDSGADDTEYFPKGFFD